MNWLGVEIAKGVSLGGIVVLNSEYKELGCVLEMRAEIRDSLLYKSYEKPVFADKLNELASGNDYVFLTISNIQNLSEKEQNKYETLLKDRNFYGYTLPANVVVTFTIDSRDDLKKISQKLYSLLSVVI